MKIDKMFIDTLREDTPDPKRAVLQAIIEFAKTADLEVIAEGVETEEQVRRLRQVGVFAHTRICVYPADAGRGLHSLDERTLIIPRQWLLRP